MSNTTYFDPYNCTYATCSVQEYGQLRYIPSLGGNAFYLSLFSLAAVLQILLGIYYRTWGFLISMAGGLALEILGYIYRIKLHFDDFDNNSFIIYLVGLTIGPAFFSAAIYLSLTRIIALYGTAVSWLKPRNITILFIGSDFLSLCLQAAGGALASLANTPSEGQTGVNLMIAGLATQVAGTTIFCILCAQLMFTIHKNPHKVNPNSDTQRKTFRFRLFLFALAIATICILVRCSFRVAELAHGFGSAIANDEALFMVLDGAMMSIAVICLTAAHPGFTLGTKLWKEGDFILCSCCGGRNRNKGEKIGSSQHRRDGSFAGLASRSFRRGNRHGQDDERLEMEAKR